MTVQNRDEIGDLVHHVNIMTESFRNIMVQIKKIATIAQNSAESAERMAASVEGQNAAMEEVAASTFLLSNMAERLRHTVGVFRIHQNMLLVTEE